MNHTAQVRVRFAPSPTGHLHVGGARTALFNWLYAKKENGVFVIRMEDTDQARSTKESEEAVLRDLQWLGLTWDEGPGVGGEYGPYRQSERTHIYKDEAHKLVAAGKAYPCFCTDDMLNAKREQAEAEKRAPHYDGTCLRLSDEERQAKLNAGVAHTFRFKVPKGQVVNIEDQIRGKVTWETDTLGDFILIRSNGMPVYNFCVAVDDALMKISHVIRAEEHLPNTLRQMLLYDAMGYDAPVFAHASLILGEDRSKMSKRHGATSVDQFANQGFTPEGMDNYLALLGWNDGSEKEIYTIEELIEAFSLDRFTKSAAVFDMQKLRWINGQHLRHMPAEELEEKLLACWIKDGLMENPKAEFVTAATELVRTSLETLNSGTEALQEVLSFPFDQTINTDEASGVKEDNFAQVAQAVIDAAGDPAFAENWKPWVKAFGKESQRKGKQLYHPLRLALTGRMSGPDVGGALKVVNLAQASGITCVTIGDRLDNLKRWMKS